MTKIIPCLLIAIGVAAVSYLLFLGQLGKASENWASVSGQILSSEVETSYARGGGNQPDRLRYLPKVVYQFEWDGQVYQSSILAYPNPGPMADEGQAQRKVASYPKGAMVSVHVNPANPKQACLETGRAWTSWMGVAISCLFVVAGVILLFKP